MGVSDKLLGGYLAFTDSLKSGEFSAKEYEAIALAITDKWTVPTFTYRYW